MYELVVKKERYWFNNDETEQIQKLNAPYEQAVSLETMIECLYHKPSSGDKAMFVGTKEIRENLKKRFPTLDDKSLTSVSIGKAMRELEFEKSRHKSGFVYSVVSSVA